MKRALIAMSGGVDSAAAAMLMKTAGFDCAGARMKLTDGFDEETNSAKAVCEKLGMPFYEFDLRGDFRENVIRKFVCSYEAGETPNPCIDCNRTMKFGVLYKKMLELGFDYIVTGHYARIVFDREKRTYSLKKAECAEKDQSYVLYSLTQELLSHILLPLGEFADKGGIREIVAQCGLDVAKKQDSQDICFVPDGDYAGFIERFSGKKPPMGEFVHVDGKTLGAHKGIINYTVGQRKGLGISYSEPLYVVKKLPDENKIILGTEKDIYSEGLFARDFNWISGKAPKGEFEAEVKTRYHAKGAPAFVRAVGENAAEIRFKEPQKAVCAGQAAVVYDGDEVLGGGTITVDS